MVPIPRVDSLILIENEGSLKKRDKIFLLENIKFWHAIEHITIIVKFDLLDSFFAELK